MVAPFVVAITGIVSTSVCPIICFILIVIGGFLGYKFSYREPEDAFARAEQVKEQNENTRQE